MPTDELTATRAAPLKALAVGLAVLGAVALVGRELLDAARFALSSLWVIAPLIALGLVVTAMLTATGSVGLIARSFAGRELGVILMVSFIGALLPVCGITVLPLVAGLLAAGVPLAPIMAFLLSSPITSPEMMAITAGTLGWPFAVGKTVAAFGIGVGGGIVTLGLTRAGYLDAPVRNSALLARLAGQGGGCEAPQTVRWRFWRDRDRLGVFRQSLLSVTKLVAIWLSLAFVAEYFLRAYVPPEALAAFVGQDNGWAIPIAATVGAPIYLDGYAALPLVRGLVDRGMADGAAMSFLLAGGITSAWAALPVFALVRLPVFGFYIAIAVIGSMLAGWGYGLAIT